MSKVKLTIGIVFSYLVATEPHWPWIWYRWIPLFRSPKGSGKKFEIARFQNNWGSVKFRTMKHFLIKYFSRCCCIGKSLSALLLLVFSNTFFRMTTGLFALESRLAQQQTNCSVRESRLFDGPHSLLVAWEFLLVLCCWQVRNNGVDLRCRERKTSN